MSHKAITWTYFDLISYLPTNQITSGFISKTAEDGLFAAEGGRTENPTCNCSVKNGPDIVALGWQWPGGK